MSIGFRINTRSQKVDLATAKHFADLPVANVSDSMNRMMATGHRLRPYHAPRQKMAGAALTVKTRPGDNLMLHKAIDMAEPGDVIVVDAGGDLSNSLMGEIMVYHAQARGVVGFVVDGAIRDVDEIRASGISMFAAGVTHRGPYKDGPGEINVPVAIDGMVINPGDLVLGDGDGVVCIPFADTDSVLAATREKQEAETRDIAAIRNGTFDRSWVDKALMAKRCDLFE